MSEVSQYLAPAVRVSGQMALPGSKSISNRVLLLAALSEGSTRIDGLLDSDDTRVMLAALRTLGLQIDQTGDNQVVVHGKGAFPQTEADLFLGNAGTAFRPLTAALAVAQGHYRLHGVPRMHERPVGDLVAALQAVGAQIRYEGQEGYPPLQISPAQLHVDGPIPIQGNVSSQFLTAFLMMAPMLAARTGRDVTLEVQGELISQPYIAITLQLMARFGVTVQQDGWQRFTVAADSRYVSPNAVAIEGDASSASYFLALGLLGQGPLQINGIGKDSIQGDIAFAQFIERLGGKITYQEQSLIAEREQSIAHQPLPAFDEDFNLIPDAAMTAAVLALYADGPCTLRNIGSWRVKETDRIHAMHTELSKLGAVVESGADWIRITPPEPGKWQTAQIATYDDHRMAMCFSLAVFGPVGVTILDPGCVSKTFPDYFAVYNTLVTSTQREAS
ncbi:3-phosphoshikimate 1-carboxyvinyltransferase [Advenella mimigardefordensis]|uniref:3-phosphoshikimate 1-carboxyvinyltransferase n=1 Tax=Advenella mimigardefordensis (strain DSM 17166 / LMG 22922 / DPN7) TaxID=1247726 RepID=W0PCA8_ADVMD|nr:3-phosphoshikimate 1-carboxyvinyltransferase [Advenella mimigardefordensis]AHG64356.1 3-phosphoshikimate 1-carboxyvinyltransferase [Advenella mimigardefordensis DPN7]